MARIYDDVTGILSTSLNSFNSGYNGRISFEGFTFTPPTTGIWLKANTLWKSPELLGAFADEGTYREQGLFQVSVFKPVGGGIRDIGAVADALLNYYERGSQLTDGTTTVKVEQSYRIGSRDQPPWIFIPVSIEFWAYCPYRS